MTTYETSLSLLDELQRQPSDVSWQRLVELYSPLIRRWLIARGIAAQDADDIVQEVLVVVFRKLPQFRREPRVGAFRRWLLNITVNCVREFWRSKRLRGPGLGGESLQQVLQALEDPHSDLSRLWEVEHDQHVTRVLLAQIRPQFEARTWEAFERVALAGQPPSQVAAALGISTNAVFIAKSRVLTQLRQAGAGVLD